MNGVTRTEAWREGLNEMGEVPVLDDGTRRLTQSGVMLTYLSDKHGQFGGSNEDERLDVLRWILFDNHKFTSYFATYRFMKAFGPTAPDPVVAKWLSGRIDNAFNIVNLHLATRSYMVAERPTIADFSLCGYLFFPVEESGYSMPERFPHIAAWLGRVRAIPGWKDPYAMLPGERVAAKW
jgi:glutathione S-transferase